MTTHSQRTGVAVADDDRPATAARTVQTRRGRRRRNTLIAFAMLAPALITLISMRIVPLVSAVSQSFQHVSLATGESSFDGFANYAYLFTDPGFYSVLMVTLVFNLILNPVIVVLSTALALLTVQQLPLVGLWRSLIFVPAAVPGAQPQVA